jgi:uncharacterized protein
MPDVRSPCIKVCVLDPKAGICTGCGRTGDEIGRWLSMSDEERKRVRKTVGGRLRQMRSK